MGLSVVTTLNLISSVWPACAYLPVCLPRLLPRMLHTRTCTHHFASHAKPNAVSLPIPASQNVSLPPVRKKHWLFLLWPLGGTGSRRSTKIDVAGYARHMHLDCMHAFIQFGLNGWARVRLSLIGLFCSGFWCSLWSGRFGVLGYRSTLWPCARSDGL